MCLPYAFGWDEAKGGERARRNNRREEAIEGLKVVLVGVKGIDLEGCKVTKDKCRIKTKARSEEGVAVQIKLAKVKEEGMPDMLVAQISRRGGDLLKFENACEEIERRIAELWRQNCGN
jgi:hypothetical protein